MKISKYSFGVGDRFGHQGKAQLKACIAAREELNIDITPVWNKSNREHTIIGTRPAAVRLEADAAVKALQWNSDYFVDADHINLNNVEDFIEPSDFFTIDVADFIGKGTTTEKIEAFVAQNSKYLGALMIPGIKDVFEITPTYLEEFASKYLLAIEEAAKVYRLLELRKGKDNFIPEVSCDETDTPQSPIDLFFILKLMAENGVWAQTIAPKFSGRFNKGVDYVGDLRKFETEFESDLLVIDFAVKEFGLPDNLKLSIHSGSDKFAIYPLIGRLLKKYDKGIHVKTAGTTWLEEIAGLAISDGAGLALAKEIYAEAYGKIDELTAPYASVIDIQMSRLPLPSDVANWSAKQFEHAIVHNQSCPEFNPDLRQLIHVGYKIAAQKGSQFYDALEQFEDNIEKQVFVNLYERHIKRMFMV